MSVFYKNKSVAISDRFRTELFENERLLKRRKEKYCDA